jgi:dipeptidyl aminopeptidase/acylaminoacyl peptidase
MTHASRGIVTPTFTSNNKNCGLLRKRNRQLFKRADESHLPHTIHKRLMQKHRVIILFLLADVVGCMGARSQQAPEVQCQPVSYTVSRYEAGGKQISIELYQPSSNGRFPVVIFIHGAGGVLTRQKQQIVVPDSDNFGEKQVACAGYIVVLPHYFESSGHAAVLDRATMRESSALWLNTLRSSIAFAQNLDKADSKRIFLYGESLGGYLSLSLAATDQRVTAVSVFGSGLPPDLPLRALPSVLVQHGAADDVVPLAEARRLADSLERAQIPAKLIIYPRLGHYPNREMQEHLVDQTLKLFQSIQTPKPTSSSQPSPPTLPRPF